MMDVVSGGHEIIVAHATPFGRATHVRSTLLQSSVSTLKSLGHFERYLALVDPAHSATIRQTLGAVWFPMEVAIAHYAACDALHLDSAELMRSGEAVGDRIQGAFLSTLSRGVHAAGVTPWLLLGHFDKLKGRILQGGSVELVKVGPKDALIDLRSTVLPRFEYFRVAFCGVVRAGLRLVGPRTIDVRIDRWSPMNDAFVTHVAWV